MIIYIYEGDLVAYEINLFGGLEVSSVDAIEYLIAGELEYGETVNLINKKGNYDFEQGKAIEFEGEIVKKDGSSTGYRCEVKGVSFVAEVVTKEDSGYLFQTEDSSLSIREKPWHFAPSDVTIKKNMEYLILKAFSQGSSSDFYIRAEVYFGAEKIRIGDLILAAQRTLSEILDTMSCLNTRDAAFLTKALISMCDVSEECKAIITQELKAAILKRLEFSPAVIQHILANQSHFPIISATGISWMSNKDGMDCMLGFAVKDDIFVIKYDTLISQHFPEWLTAQRDHLVLPLIKKQSFGLVEFKKAELGFLVGQ